MKKKTMVGAVVMTGMLLISLPLGVNRSLTKLQDEAEGYYYYDQAQAGFAIYEGVEKREAAASNLITVAKRYTEENEKLAPLVDDLYYWVNTSKKYGDFQAEAAANRSMGEAAQALYEELEQTALSEKDAKYPREMIAQMESEQDKIERSSYNEEARKFNEKLTKFPVSFLRHIAGIEPLGIFDE